MAFNIDDLETITDRIKNAVRITIKEDLQKIKVLANKKDFKGYTTRGGLLDEAYIFEQDNDLVGTITLDKVISNAPYAYAIHNGRKDWPNFTPKLFLTRAGEELKEEINEDIKTAVQKEINE